MHIEYNYVFVMLHYVKFVVHIHNRSYIASVIIAPVGGSVVLAVIITCCACRKWKRKSRSKYYTFDHQVQQHFN